MRIKLFGIGVIGGVIVSLSALQLLTNGAHAAPNTPSDPGAVRYSDAGYDITRLSQDKIAELAKDLTDEERRVLLKAGTEPAFCGDLLDNKLTGTYTCKLCGLPLFSSKSKFNSGTGWPSFHTPYDPHHINEVLDTSHGMVRTEINCARCNGHLGHVFKDGPQPTGLRYCLNSASLDFTEDGTDLPERSQPVAKDTAYFAGGCFWGIEKRFDDLPGVIEATSGYMGGTTTNPTYRQVLTGETGHAETVKIEFDPARISYKELVTAFFKLHDPTTGDRQGPDIGTQYRPVVFTTSDEQARIVRAHMVEIAQSPRLKGRPIATKVIPVDDAGDFYEAEAYHQDYHARNGGTCWLPELD